MGVLVGLMGVIKARGLGDHVLGIMADESDDGAADIVAQTGEKGEVEETRID